MSLVIDSSITLASVYSHEISQAVTAVLQMVKAGGAWAPSLWRLEVAHVLEMGVRRGRHDVAFRDATLSDLATLPVSIDLETEKHAWGATLRLAERHRLTSYDATYLELAKRRGLRLASLDTELRTAAQREGLPLLGM